jgi:TctA family transporter
MQFVTLMLPTVMEYLPAMQSMQSVSVMLPTVVEYLPAMQSMQSVSMMLPTVVEYFPDAQLMHFDVSPATSANVPAGHCDEHEEASAGE